MARIRSVKPELCTSETMAKLTAEEERTFVRLWTHCDDEGRERSNPRLIKAAIFPLHDDVTPETIIDHMARFEELGLVVTYEVAGVGYFAIPSWDEHQHPQRKKDSKYPAPTDEVLVAYASRTDQRDDADAYAPVVVVGEVDGGGEVEVAANAPAVRARKATDAEFDEFWRAYPRRVEKAAARKAFAKVVAAGIDPQVLTEAAAAYAALPGRETRFTKHPTTWLNQGCWDDELAPVEGSTPADRTRRNLVGGLTKDPPPSFRDRMVAASSAAGAIEATASETGGP